MGIPWGGEYIPRPGPVPWVKEGFSPIPRPAGGYFGESPPRRDEFPREQRFPAPLISLCSMICMVRKKKTNSAIRGGKNKLINVDACIDKNTRQSIT